MGSHTRPSARPPQSVSAAIVGPPPLAAATNSPSWPPPPAPTSPLARVAPQDGRSPLWAAACSDFTGVVERLLAAKANVDAKDNVSESVRGKRVEWWEAVFRDASAKVVVVWCRGDIAAVLRIRFPTSDQEPLSLDERQGNMGSVLRTGEGSHQDCISSRRMTGSALSMFQGLIRSESAITASESRGPAEGLPPQDGMAPLHVAALKEEYGAAPEGKTENVEQLLAAKADVDIKDNVSEIVQGKWAEGCERETCSREREWSGEGGRGEGGGGLWCAVTGTGPP